MKSGLAALDPLKVPAFVPNVAPKIEPPKPSPKKLVEEEDKNDKD